MTVNYDINSPTLRVLTTLNEVVVGQVVKVTLGVLTHADTDLQQYRIALGSVTELINNGFWMGESILVTDDPETLYSVELLAEAPNPATELAQKLEKAYLEENDAYGNCWLAVAKYVLDNFDPHVKL